MSDWYLYIVRCCDGSLYTGITTDLSRRVDDHNSGRGAKYTAPRRPVELVYQESCADRSAASRREAAVKKLSRAGKLGLIASQEIKK